MKHESDCATNNEPSLPNGACDCDTGLLEAISIVNDGFKKYFGDTSDWAGDEYEAFKDTLCELEKRAAQGSGQNSQTTSTTPARSPAAVENSQARSLGPNAPEDIPHSFRADDCDED